MPFSRSIFYGKKVFFDEDLKQKNEQTKSMMTISKFPGNLSNFDNEFNIHIEYKIHFLSVSLLNIRINRTYCALICLLVVCMQKNHVFNTTQKETQTQTQNEKHYFSIWQIKSEIYRFIPTVQFSLRRLLFWVRGESKSK